MKKIRIPVRGLAVLIASLFVLSFVTPTPGAAQSEQEFRFSRGELEQMLAPVALYPDSLLAQVLMASTYPLEIVEAERWLRRHDDLEGDALYEALRGRDWDTSVKSLCNFPDVLFALSDNLDQTRRLGDAFLGQEKDVMAVVQALRDRAYERGNLKSNKQQKIIVEHRLIRVEPIVPRVVYVPVYDPYYVYGPWHYPAYPPYYWHRPPVPIASTSYIFWGPPVYMSVGWFSWSWFDWPTFSIQIVWSDASRYHNTVVVRRDADPPYWRHDPYHRRGVVYRDPGISERFGHRRPHFAAGSGPEPRVSRPGDSAGAPRPQEWRREGNTPDWAGVEGENTRPVPRRDDGPVVTGGGRQPAPPAADRRDTVNVTRTTPEKESARPAPPRDDAPVTAGPAPETPRPTAARRKTVNFPWATPERKNDFRPTPVTEPAPVATENAPLPARPEGEKRETVNFPWAGRIREIFQPDQAPARDNFPEDIGAGLLDRWRGNRETGDARNGGTNLSRAEAPTEATEAAPPHAEEPPDREKGRVNRGNNRGGRR